MRTLGNRMRQAISGQLRCASGSDKTAQKKERSLRLLNLKLLDKNGGDLLSHLRSTIGADGLNFSVRNGKRWNPVTIAT